jgi:hypothetical protein
MTGNGRPEVTEFVVKLANEIGYGRPFTIDETRRELERFGRRDDTDADYSNVEWIREWDPVARPPEQLAVTGQWPE